MLDLRLFLWRKRMEATGLCEDAFHQIVRNAVAFEIEEADRLRDFTKLASDGGQPMRIA